MKKLIIALIIGAFVMGLFDCGDVTGAVVLGFLFLPAVFEKRMKVGEERWRDRIKVQ